MDAQAGANTPGWLHHLATRLEQASTDVLEKKMTDQMSDQERLVVMAEDNDPKAILSNLRAWALDGGSPHAEAVLMAEAAITLGDALRELGRVRASSVLWGTVVANVERAIDAHAFDDEDGNGFVPIGPLQDALSGKVGL